MIANSQQWGPADWYVIVMIAVPVVGLLWCVACTMQDHQWRNYFHRHPPPDTNKIRPPYDPSGKYKQPIADSSDEPPAP